MTVPATEGIVVGAKEPFVAWVFIQVNCFETINIRVNVKIGELPRDFRFARITGFFDTFDKLKLLE